MVSAMFAVCPLVLLLLPAAPQSYSLDPGDVVVADSRDPSSSGPSVVRILKRAGSVHVVPTSGPLSFASDVIIDRDGWIAVTDWSSYSTVYRIAPADGQLVAMNLLPLAEPFHLCRDTAGDLVVADSGAGLKKIDEHGNVHLFSPPGDPWDINIGVVLDYDGSFLVSESPNVSSSRPGEIYSVDRDGLRTLLASDPLLLNFPNGLALEPDGSLLATNVDPFYPPTTHGLARVGRNGSVTQIAWNGLVGPKDVEVLGRGLNLVADKDDESVLLVRPSGAVSRVVSEHDDGDPYNGRPVDRPFGLAVVPWVWLTTPYTTSPGQPLSVTVRTLPEFAGAELALAVSPKQAATPMASLWPGDPQTSHVDLSKAVVLRQTVPASGYVLFQAMVPPKAGLLGDALHLQAFLPGRRLLSNYVALPVR